jgi:hypothetical protein
VLLQEIQGVLVEDTSLSRQLKYNIQEKGQSEKARLATLVRVGEPDPATIQLLKSQHDEWLENPSSFWDGPAAQPLNGMAPLVQIVGCYLQNRDADP